MYRQFTNGGTERDVSRWLKEMGYRGQGLKKECLTPLCRGEMTDVWEALFVSCRPPEVVAAIKRKVDLKLQRQATIESRQKSQEDIEKRQTQLKRIARLGELAEIRHAELTSLKGQLRELRSDLSKTDGNHTQQSTVIEAKLQRTKILASFAGRTEASAKSVEEERRHLQKHNAEMKKGLAREGEIGTADFESVMQAMYDFTGDQMCRRLQKRPAGELLKPEDILPNIQAQPQSKDPGVSRLMGGLGRLYAHYAPRLTALLTSACEDARFAVSQYDAKYLHSGKKLEGSGDGYQIKGIEEMQVSHLRSYVGSNQAEEGIQRRMAGLKEAAEVQQLLAAVESAGCQEMFNAQLDAQCLQNEVETLEKERERLEGAHQPERVNEKDLKALYARMKGHVDQSHQLDLLLVYCSQQLSQLKREFDRIRVEVEEKLIKALQSAVSSCIEGMRGCQGALGKELERFSKFDLTCRPFNLSLSEDSASPQFPLLQRWDMAFSNAPSESAPYWISSLREMAVELRHLAPLMRMESPEALFIHLSAGLQLTLTNGQLLEHLHREHACHSKSVQKLASHSMTLAERHRETQREADATTDQLDEMDSKGHSTLHLLRIEVPAAYAAFKDQSAFSSVPWIRQDGMNVSEWVNASKHKRTLTQDHST